MRYPVRLYVRFRGHDGSPEWKSLCIVYDAEAYGWLERFFNTCEIEFKTEEVRWAK